MHPEQIRLAALDRVLAGRGLNGEKHAAAMVKAAAVIETYILRGLDVEAIDNINGVRGHLGNVGAVDPGDGVSVGKVDLFLLAGTDNPNQITNQSLPSVGHSVSHSESSVGNVEADTVDQSGRIGNDPAGERS